MSVGSKLASATFALIVLVTAAVYFQLSHYQRESLLGSKEAAASAVARLFADSCTAAVVFSDDAALKESLAALGRDEQVEYAAVWASDGQRAVDPALGEFVHGDAEFPSEIPTSMRLERRAARLVVTAAIRKPTGPIIGLALIAFSMARENAAIASVQRQTLIVSASVAIVLTVLLMAITRIGIVTPLGQLVMAAKRLEAGGRVGDVDIRSNDEIGQLATAFRSMAVAIGQREEHIESRNADMRLVLDNVGQGFVTLDLSGKMAGDRSRIVAEWFGEPAPDMSFGSYLSGVDAELGAGFEIGWCAVVDDVMPLELSIEQLPRAITATTRTFELAYRPIMKDSALHKMIVVITDVSARIESERAERMQRETVSIFHRILADRSAFEDFFAEATCLVEAIDGYHPEDGPDAVSLLKARLHTLKGNCGLFGIESVASCCHELETRLEQSGGYLSAADRQELRRIWSQVSLMRAQVAPDADALVQLEVEEYRRFLRALRRREDHSELLLAAESWPFEPANRRLALICDQLSRLAARLGKPNLETYAQPTALRLPPRKWGPFWSVFAHVVRNTVDHGVQSVEQRVAQGKPERAHVAVSVCREGTEVVVSVRDDGAGIDWEKIEARARQRGLAHASRDDLQEALFADGVSTQDEISTTSGRGVGLGAVRAAVRGLSGRIEILSERGQGTTLRFVFPASMLVDESAPSLTDAA